MAAIGKDANAREASKRYGLKKDLGGEITSKAPNCFREKTAYHLFQKITTSRYMPMMPRLKLHYSPADIPNPVVRRLTTSLVSTSS
ncbi:MAG: hypothetical protein AAF723_09955, partial [Pseudomonadota bacterium]